MDNRSFPDITFVESDTESLAASIISGYERETGRTLYPADPVRVFLLYLAQVISQERAIMNDIAKQNVPRYARGEKLDSLSEIFRDIHRLGAVSAKTTLRFEISELQSIATIIPAGTRATVDGQIMFATEADAVIPAGETSVTVSAVCNIPGSVGNGFLPGQVAGGVDIFPYYKAVTNITETGGGSDPETDEEFYARMRQSVESYSTAGPSGSYIYHAKSASAQVADVTANSPSAGVVDIRVLCEGGKLPDEELIGIISDVLNDSKIRPMTDQVIIQAPTVQNFNVDITYYVDSKGGISLADAETAVNNAVDSYISWQTAKIGRDINPSYLTQLVMQAGIKRVEVNSPVYTPISGTEVAQLGTRTVNSGGYEDE